MLDFFAIRFSATARQQREGARFERSKGASPAVS
jgi:hypothetical protein